MRFLDRFDAILFDMCGTFMFGHDRFGPEDDLFATYGRLGGARMSRGELDEAFRLALEMMRERYDALEHFEDFPSVRECFEPFCDAADLGDLETVFVAHEIGRIPEENQTFLRDLKRTHWIGVVSNICAHPDRWVSQSPDAETFRAFDHLVFSSEGRVIKPSLRIFERALAAVPAGKRVLFVGDNLQRDIIPAKSLGLGTAWIAPVASAHPDADVAVQRLTDLATLKPRP